METSSTILIGIDPDVNKSGVAIKVGRQPQVELMSLDLYELIDYLTAHIDQIRMVRVEAGWLNSKSNFRSSKVSKSQSEAISKQVGRNHEIGRQIEKFLQRMKIQYQLVRPLKKRWRGMDGKITHEEFIQYFKQQHKSSNQEQRDAALLIL